MATTATQPPPESSLSSLGLIGPEDVQDAEVERRLQEFRRAGLFGSEDMDMDLLEMSIRLEREDRLRRQRDLESMHRERRRVELQELQHLRHRLQMDLEHQREMRSNARALVERRGSEGGGGQRITQAARIVTAFMENSFPNFLEARMDFSATSSSSSSSSSSSFSWTAPRDAAVDLSNEESDATSDKDNSGGGGSSGIDADAERRELAAVRDFKRKTLRALQQEKEKLDEWVEAERRKKATDSKSKMETDAMRARLEEIRADLVTLKMLTSFKEDDIVKCVVCLSNTRTQMYDCLKCGNLVCGECRPRLKLCPSCRCRPKRRSGHRRPTWSRRNRWAERLARVQRERDTENEERMAELGSAHLELESGASVCSRSAVSGSRPLSE